MISVDKQDRKRLSVFFQDYKWNYIPDAILDGVMGEAWVDDHSNPSVVVLEIPSLQLFIAAGEAKHPAARKFLENLPKYAALIFATEGWEAQLEEIQAGKFESILRSVFSSEKLDREHLSQLAGQIPDNYQCRQIDLDLAQQLAAEKSRFTEDHLQNFDSPGDFIQRGFGFCILAGDEIVSAATTFAICNKGIEIQINTREEQRRKGLGTIVAAHLMLHSLQRGLDPNWDAVNQRSARLAEKLGYTPRGRYPMYFITG